jgi:hypothetical protein
MNERYYAALFFPYTFFLSVLWWWGNQSGVTATIKQTVGVKLIQ